MTNNHSGQGTGASVPDQALAVPAEPVARLGPTGFDPSRLFELADQCERASGPDRDSDGSPQGTDPKGLDGEAATARAEGIAPNPPETPERKVHDQQ
jgi:hypothetical protein